MIIGSGPAGYTAAIYLSRARLSPVLFSGQEIGGQLMYTTDVENFPGFPNGVAGHELMFGMREQAEKFGTKIIDEKVEKLEILDKGFRVHQGGEVFEAKTVIIATGAQARMLGLEGEMEWLGKGLSTCAVCDAAFYRGKNVLVIGGGDSAMEDTLALTKFADKITLIHRSETFRASKIMQERVLSNEKVTVKFNTQLTGFVSEGDKLTGAVIKTGDQEETMMLDGIFYAIGHVPATKFLPEEIKRNAEGYIVTHMGMDQHSVGLAQKYLEKNSAVTYLSATSVPGIFAAGDCVDFRYRQAITAAAFGTMSALDVERYLETH